MRNLWNSSCTPEATKALERNALNGAKLFTICRLPFVVKPGERRALDYYHDAVFHYVDQEDTGKEQSLLLARPTHRALWPNQKDKLWALTCLPKPGFVAAQNVLLRSCLIYPNVEVFTKEYVPNFIVHAIISVCLEVSTAAEKEAEVFLGSDYAQEIALIASVYHVTPHEIASWSAGDYQKALAVANVLYSAVAQTGSANTRAEIPRMGGKFSNPLGVVDPESVPMPNARTNLGKIDFARENMLLNME